MILLAHPTGNANVRHAALALRRRRLLGEFWTCLNYRDRALFRLLPGGVRRQLQRRANPPELLPCLHTFPVRELARLLAPRAGLDRLVRHETGMFSIDAVYRALDRRVSRRLRAGDFRGIYAYEDGAADSFRTAARLGRLAFYDLPIGYWRAARALLSEEAELQPAWASTLGTIRDSAEKTARKDAELALADVVFVASSFTRRTLESAPPFRARVIVTPYGAPAAAPPGVVRPAARAGTLRALFVGSLGQRKGLSYLFEACRSLGTSVQLTVIGIRPAVDCPPLDRALASVRWLPGCPHEQILAEMAAHDVFGFPARFAGFGLGLLEAMAMGLPVITTPHTAGPDLIEEGRQGFIVPIRAAGAIAEKLDLLRRDPARLAGMGREARLRAASFTWASYEAKLASSIHSALGPIGRVEPGPAACIQGCD